MSNISCKKEDPGKLLKDERSPGKAWDMVHGVLKKGVRIEECGSPLGVLPSKGDDGGAAERRIETH